MTCILMTSPGGKHSTGFVKFFCAQWITAPSASRSSGAHKTKSNPAGVHCGHLGKECNSCLSFSANCFGLLQKAVCLHLCSGRFFKWRSKVILSASSRVSVFRRAAQSVSRGQRSEAAAVCKGRGLLSAQISKSC